MAKKTGKPSKNKNRRSNRKSRIITDGIVFFIIILALSFSIIIISSMAQESTGYYENYGDSDDYIENSMQNILSSTVPSVIYQDSTGSQNEYTGQTVERLIQIDLNIRASSNGFNQSSLKLGIGHELEKLLNSAYGVDKSYIFTAVGLRSSSSESVAEISISNLLSPPQVDGTEPVFEKQLKLSNGDRAGTDISEVNIRLYLI